MEGILSNDSDEQSGILVTSGDGERSVVMVQADAIVDDPSKVVGVAEREVEGEVHGQDDLDVQAQPSVVAGIAERIIVLEEGIDMPDDDSKVVGVAERIIEQNEQNAALVDSDATVTGVAERIIDQNIDTERFEGAQLKPTDNNIVTGVAHRS